MSRRTENLIQLLGASFHQDWTLDHGSAEECLDGMVREASIEQQRLGAREIASLLDGTLCENQIKDVLLYEIGCYYAFENDGFEASSWLRHVRRRLLDHISRKEHGTSGPGAGDPETSDAMGAITD